MKQKFGDTNHDGTLSGAETTAVGYMRTLYLIILSTHIVLAAVILPFILFTAYRALIAEYPVHKRLARYMATLVLCCRYRTRYIFYD